MGHFQKIQQKLEQFIRKYYTNELVKGAILFFAIGLLYFLLTLLVEHFLWLNKIGRAILFWLFIIVELGLFIKLIFIPIAKLLKLRKGIGYQEASKIIGSHFPDVNDKLLNVLQLSENKNQSELLLAGIEQKSSELQSIPFQIAINIRKNVKYAKYAIIPLSIILLALIFNKTNWFSNSYNRFVNYDIAYEPPAPFQFFIVNKELNAIENVPFKLEVNTLGEIIPQETQIHIENETYFLQSKQQGQFEYIFTQPKSEINFHLSANGVNSKPYTLKIIKVPSLTRFEMVLDYPSYTKKQDEILKSSGNATVPEGSKITWKLKTVQTNNVELITKDTTLAFTALGNDFNLTKSVYTNLDYHISTSNKNLKNYENLGFSIDVIKDEYPEINLKSARDSLNNQVMYFLGQISDDYGLSKLQLVYYPQGKKKNKAFKTIPINRSNFDQFTYSFPNNLPLVEGENYAFYFEIYDNDALRKGKSTKSAIFNYRKLTKAEIEKQQLEQQNETIKDLENSLEKIEENKEKLEELSNTNKEKNELNFNDKKRLENFLNRQHQQEQMLQKFSEKLQQNLEEFKKGEEEDEYKKLLKERLERQQKEMEKNEKLLEELKEISDKINKEKLSKKLEELAKKQKNNERSLEQILELTKRYYVSAKAEKIKKDLEELAKKQEELSNKEGKENTKEEQEKLNKAFNKLQKEMDELQKDNEELKKPMAIEQDKKAEENIKKEQKEASKNLEEKEKQEASEEQKNQNQKNAQKNQKNAAQKMKQMSKKMQSSMQMGGEQAMMEDAEMLRQILDNLVVFSFDQEELMEKFKGSDNDNPNYSKYLKNQNHLRLLFEHIDDSLFSLSLRRPELSEKINENITAVFYSIDKSLAHFAENQVYQGVGNQQYTLTNANELASFLSDALDNMQQQMSSGSGKPGSKEQQLPDIIQSQEELNNKMQKGMKEGKKQGDSKGDKGQQGESENKESGQKKGGESGKEKEGDFGQGNNEQMSEQVYEIFKQQQQLRQLLEQQIKGKKGQAGVGDAKGLIKEMERIEDELLQNGLNERTLQRMTNLKHQLLKLEKAAFQQGKKEERESKANQQQYNNSTNNETPDVKQYFNQVEILNRQVLPLRQIYKRKVQEYFKNDDSL